MPKVTEPTERASFPAGERIEVGPANLHLIQSTAIHELQQVRQEYDPKGIEELALAIILDPELLKEGVGAGDYETISRSLDLSHPFIIAQLDDEHLDKFLADHARHYDIEPQQLIPDDGDALVRVSGHRRHRALELTAKWYGFEMDRLYVQSTIHENISFREALRKQYTENISERPPAIDEAKSISSYYEGAKRDGENPTYASVAAAFGCSETKVSSALAFVSLPAEIRAYAEETGDRPALPYSIVARLRPLADAYEAKYDARDAADKASETKEQYIVNSLAAMSNKLTRMKLQRQPVHRILEVLTAQTRSTKGELRLVTEELFTIEQDTSSDRRQRSSEALASVALNVLELLAKQGELADSLVARMQELTDAAKAQAEPAEVVQMDSLFDMTA